MTMGEKIALLRRQRAWSQEELAEKLGVSRQSVSKWESGGSIPDLERVVRLAELFDVSGNISHNSGSLRITESTCCEVLLHINNN